VLDESFLDKFKVDHEDLKTLMEVSFVDEEWSVNKRERCIPSHYLKYPYKILNMMICKLCGEDINTHFRMEWFPMASTIMITGKEFNWANIPAYQLKFGKIKVWKTSVFT